MIGLDTNILVRYFAQDDTAQAQIASRFIESQLDERRPGHVSLVTLAELMWVMRTRYGTSKDDAVTIAAHLLGDARFVVQAALAVWAALDAYRQNNVDFSDALIAALNRAAGCSHTMTFDRHAARLAGVQLLGAPS